LHEAKAEAETGCYEAEAEAEIFGFETTLASTTYHPWSLANASFSPFSRTVPQLTEHTKQ